MIYLEKYQGYRTYTDDRRFSLFPGQAQVPGLKLLLSWRHLVSWRSAPWRTRIPTAAQTEVEAVSWNSLTSGTEILRAQGIE